MLRKAYVIHWEDAHDTGADSLLRKLDVPVLIHGDVQTLPDEFRDYHVIAVCAGKRHPAEEFNRKRLFPSKHIRVLGSPEDAMARGFDVPDWAADYASDSGISFIFIDMTRHSRAGLKQALENAHFKVGDTWYGDKKKRPSRRHLLLERRNERRMEHLPMK